MTRKSGCLLARIMRGPERSIRGPKAAERALARGNANSKQGKLEQAIADYTRAIALDPKLADAYHSRGLALMRKRLNPEAVADFETYLRLNPNAENRAQVEQLIRELK